MRCFALAVGFVALLALAALATAGGIADEPCPNVRGENTHTCPPATVGASYGIRFTEREGSGCGPGRQTFHLDWGVLPPGLSLAPTGLLHGTPLAPGRFQFFVEMREPTDDPATCGGKETQKEFTLFVRRAPWIVTPRPHLSEVGVPMRIALRARGGTGIFVWALAAGRLPRGVKLGADGLAYGVPRRAGRYTFTVIARDTEARTIRWTGSVEVSPRLRLETRRVPPAIRARPYRLRLRAAGGVGRREWHVIEGRLPRGVRLVPSKGELVGVPSESGHFRVTARVRDALRVDSSGEFVLVVTAPRTKE